MIGKLEMTDANSCNHMQVEQQKENKNEKDSFGFEFLFEFVVFGSDGQ